MENITFVKYRSILAHYFSLIAVIFVFGSASSYGNTYVYNHGEKILHEVNVNDKSNIKQNSSNEFWDLFSIRSLDLSRTDIDYSGVYSSNSVTQISAIPLTILDSSSAISMDSDGDGVTDDKENADGTDPNNSCDFILAHQNCTPSTAWKNADCDGDGVTNNKEKIDGTDPLDPCDFVLGHQNCSPSTEWKNADCDGDGVTNEKEKEDGTDPLDPCDFVLAHQNCSPSTEWKNADCDGDGVTNVDEKSDGTDPLDPCDYDPDHVTVAQCSSYLPSDCDGDGVTNGKEIEDGTDPLDPCDFVLAHQNCSPSTEWKNADCDGDGVTNEKEKEDGTDPLDPCDFVLAHQNCTPSTEWKNADCDGDGVTNEVEKTDGTDPLDPCDFVLAHQNCSPSTEWKNTDCDGDGVTNEDEKTDGTDPLDPCDYNPEHITLPQSGDYLTADCDGDGVTNENEKEDGTDPLDPCDFVLAHQTVAPSNTWNDTDCDGDGVTNEDEKEDGTDPLDPCDYNPESVTLTPSVDWEVLDCDNDGNPNGTDPDPLVATARDDSGSTPAMTEVAINILENDDYLPNNHPDNLGITALSMIGGSALGTVTFDEETGFLTYTPVESESNSTVTIIYQVCNLIPDPSVCASATVTIQVGPDMDNVIDAVDDSYSVDTDVSGVIPDSNVLGNDTINGEVVAAADIVLTSTPTDELTINEDGSVSVAPGTADGTYTIEYTICEAANTDNCDTATVTIQVGPDMGNVIDAVDDSYTVDTGVSGVIPDSNVLGNDTINGEVVAAVDVVLTSTPTDELTINEDGSVSVAPGTADGTYTIEYTICEVANTDNCDTGTVTVQVGPDMENVIDAVDDSYTVDTGVSGVISDSNVLGNDTINGEIVAATDLVLTSTPTDELTINEDGSVSVAPGTADGTYTIEYTICEAANTDNCDTGTVTVQVGPDMDNVIDAVDDSYSVDTGVSGVIPDSNLLGNDTINGEIVATTEVVLTSTPTDELTINEDGSVSVAPGTADGTYTIEYTICEVANTENCDTGTVTVQVGPDMDNVIVAVDDAYTTDTNNTGLITGSNVLDNDTLNGDPVASTDVVLTSTPTDVLTINEDGSVSVAPGTADGTYTIDYMICEAANAENCDTATVTVIIEEGDEDEKIEVNQLVTPNSDGKNDFLFIRGVRNANNNTLKIFNRWGVSVYEGKGYNNQNNVFDGRSKARSTVTGNNYLPAGVYYYIFQYENKQQNITDSGYIYVSK